MANYILLERIELNASAASVTFSNIPQTGYTDLKVVASVRSDKPSYGFSNFALSINGSTANLATRYLEGSGSAATSGSTTTGAAGNINGPSSTANVFSNTEFYFPNYTSSNYKSWSEDHVTEANATTAWMDFFAGLWSNTAAITSITFTEGNSSTFSQYSTFSLYGLAAVGSTPAIAPKAAGGSIYTDGTYWYHAFRTSGTFVPQVGISADVLVVAGGGGGQAGGGGAGGLLAFTSQSLAASTSYTCTIGAGGANQTNGANSTFGALTAAVGGGGSSGWGTAGQNGGSGGGGGSVSGTTVNGGTATSGQGNNGGSGVNSGAGGGGGAGAAGANGNTNGGAGGIGSSTYSSWGSATVSGQNVSGTYYFAGGGGGGNNSGASPAGGSGGGGTGSNASPTAGTVNTGGGGGGAYNAAGQPGGSGIIIVRYLAA